MAGNQGPWPEWNRFISTRLGYCDVDDCLTHLILANSYRLQQDVLEENNICDTDLFIFMTISVMGFLQGGHSTEQGAAHRARHQSHLCICVHGG